MRAVIDRPEQIALPFAVIDFEASSLSLSEWPEISSYPVEVGVAIASVEGTISSWSTLIRPPTLWTSQGESDRRSERVHGITREELTIGQSPSEVATTLNALLSPVGEAWCDELRYDQHWLNVLFRSADVESQFTLRQTSGLASHVRADMIGSRAHRAGPDAEQICSALLAGR